MWRSRNRNTKYAKLDHAARLSLVEQMRLVLDGEPQEQAAVARTAESWWNCLAGAADRATLESDPSADAGDGATGQGRYGPARYVYPSCAVEESDKLSSPAWQDPLAIAPALTRLMKAPGKPAGCFCLT